MTKNTMGTKLPRKLVQKMSIVGEQIKLARFNYFRQQFAQESECGSDSGTRYLLSVDRVPNRERHTNSSNRNLLASVVCFAA